MAFAAIAAFHCHLERSARQWSQMYMYASRMMQMNVPSRAPISDKRSPKKGMANGQNSRRQRPADASRTRD